MLKTGPKIKKVSRSEHLAWGTAVEKARTNPTQTTHLSTSSTEGPLNISQATTLMLFLSPTLPQVGHYFTQAKKPVFKGWLEIFYPFYPSPTKAAKEIKDLY